MRLARWMLGAAAADPLGALIVGLTATTIVCSVGFILAVWP